MTPYETDWNLKINIVFKPIVPKITISKLLAQNNLSQLHLAETEKYAHITYFFNGGMEKEQNKEKFLLVASPRVNSYDQTPQMSAKEITLALKNELNTNLYDFIAINLANCDMVGHTGNFKAIIKAAESVDYYLKEISQVLNNYGYNIFITADHGNAEQAINPSTGEIDKQHTINPVFFINLNPDCFRPAPYLNHQNIWLNLALEQKKAVLCDVAATLSDYLNIKNENFAGEKIL
jgi:2,3-bisphosphoglycerate-independent phosphoglycerate mutase